MESIPLIIFISGEVEQKFAFFSNNNSSVKRVLTLQLIRNKDTCIILSVYKAPCIKPDDKNQCNVTENEVSSIVIRMFNFSFFSSSSLWLV